MPPAVAIALVVLVALVALLVLVILRRPGGARAADLIQQQLIELRTRFDQLVAAQQEVPRTLAQGSMEQQRMLAVTGAAAERERRTFARSLRERIDEIADKYIRPDEGTYDFALMYIPAENVYYEAVLRAEDPEDANSVLGHAMRRRVIPESPHTFYAYLLVILHGLKGMRVEQQAREIQERLGSLRQQFDAFWTAFETVGAHLGNAQKKFTESERHAGRVRERFDAITGADDGERRPPIGPGGGPA